MHFGVSRNLASGDLVSELLHRLVRRTDELDIAASADFGEVRVFGQEPIPRVNRLHVADFRGADDPVDHQVALGRTVSPDAVGFVGEFQVAGVAVGLAVDRHRLDSQLVAGADDPKGDLAAIGDQDALEHKTVTNGVAAGVGVRSAECGRAVVRTRRHRRLRQGLRRSFRRSRPGSG